MSPVQTENANVQSTNPSSEPEANIRPQTQLTDQTNLLPPRHIITVMLALVSASFNAGSLSAWIPAAYLMTSTAFQPLYGRLSDIFGRKSAIALAMGIYIVGNLIAGFSQSIIQLIVFRAIAGIGDGGATSMVQIVISDVVTLRDRGKFIGYAAAVTAAGYTAGPIIGGSLAQHVSWRWAFWITLPVALVATLVVVFTLPLKPVTGNMRSKLLMIDYVGVFLTLATCIMIMLPLVWGGVTFPWKSAVVLGPLCGGIVAVGIFCVWETKVARLPLVPMYIFRHMTVVGVYICMFVNGFVFFSLLFYLPQFFQVVLGYSPTRSGIFIIPLAISQVVSAVAGGLWVSRTGKYRLVVYFGFGLFSIACGCMTLFNGHTSPAVMVVLMTLAGLGTGATLQTTTVAVQASVARQDMAVVSAVRNFLRMLGGALALPSSAALLDNAIRASLNGLSLPSTTITSIINDPSILRNSTEFAQYGLLESQADFILSNGYNEGFKDIIILDTSLATLAFVVSVFMIKHKELLRGDEDRLKAEAKEALRTTRESGVKVDKGDIEMGPVTLQSHNVSGRQE